MSYWMPAAWEIGSRNGGIRNLSMKKFGTPTRPGPGVASEKVGLEGEGGVAVDDDPREPPPTSRGLSGSAVVFGWSPSHGSAALPRASEGRRPPPERVRPLGPPPTKSL